MGLRRLYLKPDSESAIGRGGIVGPQHLKPHIARILEVALDTSPDDRIVLTEGWRPPTHRKDKHSTWEAFDFRASHLDPFDAEDWAARIGDRLGSDYDVVAHGLGENFHLHVEYDPEEI